MLFLKYSLFNVELYILKLSMSFLKFYKLTYFDSLTLFTFIIWLQMFKGIVLEKCRFLALASSVVPRFFSKKRKFFNKFNRVTVYALNN